MSTGNAFCGHDYDDDDCVRRRRRSRRTNTIRTRTRSGLLEQVTYSNMHSSAIGTIIGSRYIGSLFM